MSFRGQNSRQARTMEKGPKILLSIGPPPPVRSRLKEQHQRVFNCSGWLLSPWSAGGKKFKWEVPESNVTLIKCILPSRFALKSPQCILWRGVGEGRAPSPGGTASLQRQGPAGSILAPPGAPGEARAPRRRRTHSALSEPPRSEPPEGELRRSALHHCLPLRALGVFISEFNEEAI